MPAVHAFIKQAYLDKSGNAPVILEYSHLKQRWRINTGIKVNPGVFHCIFDEDIEMFKLTPTIKLKETEKEQLRRFNGTLLELNRKLLKVIEELKLKALSLNPQNVKTEFTRKPENTADKVEKSVQVWYADFIRAKEEEIGDGINSYRSTYEHFKSFSKERGVLKLQDINRDFLTDFRRFLLAFELSGPTLHKQFKNLRIFLNWVAEQGEDEEIKIPRAYKKLGLKARYGDPIGLSMNQFLEFYNIDLSFSWELDRTRDLFVFGVSIGGPRHGDLKHLGETLSHNGFRMNHNVISYFESKTGNAHQEIFLNNFGMNVLEKYNYAFPHVPSNFRMNKNLKSIASKLHWNEYKSVPHYDDFGKLIRVDQVELKDIFSTKFMRKTAATIDNTLGVPIKTSMKRTGHKTFAAYSRYVDVNRDSLQQANVHWDDLLLKHSSVGVSLVEIHELRFAA